MIHTNFFQDFPIVLNSQFFVTFPFLMQLILADRKEVTLFFAVSGVTFSNWYFDLEVVGCFLLITPTVHFQLVTSHLS